MRRFAFTLAVILELLTIQAFAAPRGKVIAVTNTSQTVFFDGPVSSLVLYNCSDGSTATCAGESAWVRFFDCNQTAVAAVAATAPAVGIALGESFSFPWAPGLTMAAPICSITIITASSTANVRATFQ